MIAIIGSGRIGKNVNRHLTQLKIANKLVSRLGNSESISWQDFIDNLSSFDIVINCATLKSVALDELMNRITSKHYLIHLSSVSVYGDQQWLRPCPINDYGFKKLKEEETIKSYKRDNLLIIRLANVFGGTPETSPVLELLNKSQLRIQNFSIDGNNVVRDFVHISHLLNFLALCSYNSTCGIYNFSNGLPVAVKDMLELRSGLKIDSFEAADKIDPLLTSSGEPGQMTE